MTIPSLAEPERPIRVLLVDDDEDDYLLTREYLQEVSAVRFEVDWVADYDSALEVIGKGAHDVYLLDYRLGPRTGLDLLAQATTAHSAPFILLTGQGERELDYAAMKAGAADYLDKSRLDATLLQRAIRYALQQKRSEADLERLVRERTADLERTNAALHEEIQERRRAAQALREADRRKDEFLATLAHELRNPLAPIRNALEIMRIASADPEAMAQARAMMDRQVRQMVRLIDDLLDVSRITQGKLRLVVEAVELHAIIEAALEISRPALDKAGLDFQVELPAEPIVLAADRVRLAQVFSNLLNNAAKYSEYGGRVALAVTCDADEVAISVRDTGIGIPPEMLPQVFELFNQINRSLNRSEGGLGLGLTLVQRLVQMHGGTVEAHSEGVGRGAEFIVRLPRRPVLAVTEEK